MTDLYNAMSTLRAVRRLRPDPIAPPVLERVLQAACWAPTGGNQQPWRVIVVTDRGLKTSLAEIYRPLWDGYSTTFRSRLGDLPEEEMAKWDRVMAAGDHLAEHLSDAPAILVFVANPAMMAITDIKAEHVSVVGGGSVYPAVQNAMLACVAEGLGCTLTTLHCMEEPAVAELLGVPEGWAVPALVPIGYPVGKGHGPITRRPPQKMAYSNHFGEAWQAETS
jgi:nitroreductase